MIIMSYRARPVHAQISKTSYKLFSLIAYYNFFSWLLMAGNPGGTLKIM